MGDAELVKGTTFASGGSVTHTNLNDLVDSGTLGPSASEGAIGGQTEETSVASGDFVLIQDVSGTDILRKATVANLISGMGITQTADNTAVGDDVLASISSGTGNVAVGRQALTAQTTGSNSTAVGHQAAHDQQGAAEDNVVIGYQAAYSNVNGDDSVVIGSMAARNLATSTKCVAVGKGAMQDADVLIVEGVAVGYEALKNAEYTTGTEGAYNVAVGSYALTANTTGLGSTAVGQNALKTQTTPDWNSAFGYNALMASTTGSGSTAVGAFALGTQTTPSYNSALGYNAGFNTLTAEDCTYLGKSTGFTNSTGDDNTFVGDNAGYYVTAAQNTALGSAANSLVGAAAYVNTTALGYEAAPSGSNEVTLGNASVTALKCQVQTVTALSDERIKENIQPIDLGLRFIKGLKGVSYNKKNPADWDEDIKEERFKGESPDERPEDNDALYRGFIAQEVKALMDAQGVTDWEGWSTDDKGRQNLGVGALVPVLVKAVQELSAKVAALEAAS